MVTVATMDIPSFTECFRKGGRVTANGAGLSFSVVPHADPDAYAFALAAVGARVTAFRSGWTLGRPSRRGECPRCGMSTHYQIDGACPLCRSAARKVAAGG